MNLLELLRQWYDDHADGPDLEFSTSTSAVDKPSAWVTASSKARMGRLTIWETGEAELDLADVETGKIEQEHRDISGEVGLRDATETLMHWVQDV